MPVGWVPSDLGADLLAEWNIAEQAGESGGAAIVQLDDTSGNSVHGTQATGTSRATYRATALNGLGAADFDSGDFYDTTLSASATNETIIAVVRTDSLAGSPAIISSIGNGGRALRFTTTGQLQFIRSNVTAIASSTGTVPNNAVAIVSLTYDATDRAFHINGAAAGSGSYTQAWTAGLSSRIARDVSVPFDGHMYYLASTTELADADREAYEGYLADLFGIPLVMGHPERRATRFYLASSGSPAVSPAFDAEWEETGSAAQLPLTMTRGSTAFATETATEANATANRDVLVAQFVGPQVEGGSWGGVFAGQIRASESAAGMNARLQAILKMVSADGSTVTATLYAGDLATLTGNPPSELTTSLVNRTIPKPGALNVADAVETWGPGDRPVLELGVRAHNTSATSFTASLRVGENSSTALPIDESTTADDHPWLDVGFAFVLFVPISGSAALTTTGTAMARKTARGSGSAAITTTGTATAKEGVVHQASGSAAITATASATAQRRSLATGAASITTTGAAASRYVTNASGSAAVSLAGNAAAQRRQSTSGSAAIATTATATAQRRSLAIGSAAVTATPAQRPHGSSLAQPLPPPSPRPPVPPRNIGAGHRPARPSRPRRRRREAPSCTARGPPPSSPIPAPRHVSGLRPAARQPPPSRESPPSLAGRSKPPAARRSRRPEPPRRACRRGHPARRPSPPPPPPRASGGSRQPARRPSPRPRQQPLNAAHELPEPARWPSAARRTRERRSPPAPRRPITLAGSATARRRQSGSASAGVSTTATATGQRRTIASGAAAIVTDGTATGQRRIRGAASAAATFTAAANAVVSAPALAGILSGLLTVSPVLDGRLAALPAVSADLRSGPKLAASLAATRTIEGSVRSVRVLNGRLEVTTL